MVLAITMMLGMLPTTALAGETITGTGGGNKRVRVLAMLITLRLNGIVVKYTQQELTDLGLAAASGDVGY